MLSDGSRIASRLNPISIAVVPSGDFLYVANWGTHDISAYLIRRPSGFLIPIEGSPFAAGRWPHSLAAAPKAPFLYSANGDSDDVTGFRMDPATGRLEEICGLTVCGRGRSAFIFLAP